MEEACEEDKEPKLELETPLKVDMVSSVTQEQKVVMASKAGRLYHHVRKRFEGMCL